MCLLDYANDRTMPSIRVSIASFFLPAKITFHFLGIFTTTTTNFRWKAPCLSTLCLLVCFEIDLFLSPQKITLRTEAVLYSLRLFTFSWKNLFNTGKNLHSYLFALSIYFPETMMCWLWSCERSETKTRVISEKKAGCHLEFLPGKEAQTQDRTQRKKNTT